MVNVVLDNGYFTGMACKVGKFENGIDVEALPNEVDPIKQRAYRLENDRWVFDGNKYQELLIVEKNKVENEQKQVRINQIKSRLNELSKDFIQAYLGASIPNLDVKKQEFVRLHNEVRSLQDQEPRVYYLS